MYGIYGQSMSESNVPALFKGLALFNILHPIYKEFQYLHCSHDHRCPLPRRQSPWSWCCLSTFRAWDPFLTWQLQQNTKVLTSLGASSSWWDHLVLALSREILWLTSFEHIYDRFTSCGTVLPRNRAGLCIRGSFERTCALRRPSDPSLPLVWCRRAAIWFYYLSRLLL